MSHTAIEQTLSIKHFSTYRQAAITADGTDCIAKALQLYEWNAEPSSRFFLPLHAYEEAMRNTISDAISIRYGQNLLMNTVFQNPLNDSGKGALLSVISRAEIFTSVHISLTHTPFTLK